MFPKSRKLTMILYNKKGRMSIGNLKKSLRSGNVSTEMIFNGAHGCFSKFKELPKKVKPRSAKYYNKKSKKGKIS